ncbi:hypothetical protein ACI6PS_14920 [Flavobacterium sp. PLA-1-15]|uniref:hypothetical protein n=1 Tax=Flavobacterium sp. PLA-1-15 TaxID=3380533 RepID=UPI003B7B2650
MKKLMITGILLLFALFANAQQTGTRYKDTEASPPTPPPPPEINKNEKVEGIKKRSDSEIQAEKKAKQKSSSKNQTRVNPEKIAPVVGDTVKNPKPLNN